MSGSQCISYVKKEFQLKNFGLDGIHRARFGHSQWPIPVGVYLGYRFVLAAYVTFWLLFYVDWKGHGLAVNGTTLSFAAFLTVWTYFILMLYLVTHFVVCLVYYCTRGGNPCSRPVPERHRRMFNELEVQPSLWASGRYDAIPADDPEMEAQGREPIMHYLPWYYKPVWVLYNIATNFALLVTIVFFIFLWPTINTDGKPIDMENFQQHAVNSIIIFIDCLIVAIPTRVLHYIYPLIYGIIYITFSAIYWAGDHRRVMYPNILDWNKPGQTMTFIVILAFVGLPMLHMLYFAIYKLKLFIYDKLYPENAELD